jgi:parallel beta-helix repeat protein
MIWASQNNTVYGNNIAANSGAGILFGYSSYNTVIGNNIAADSIGILLWSSNGASTGSSSNNTIYHNSFVNNGEQVSTHGSPLPSPAPLNVWDDGYPSGGNYWSDYHGIDVKKGQDQDMPGNDGIGDTSYVIDGNNTDHYPLILNPLVPAHDIAVNNVTSSKTVIGRGFSGNVSVYVGNDGQSAETFNVTAYANTTVIGTQQVNNLNATGQMALTFMWNTTGLAYGNYTISAYAWPVPGETDTSDNDRATAVHVSVPGDINGDGRVDMKDIGEAARAFNTVAGAAKWDTNADINNDGKIDMKDISTVARHFGEHYP